MTNCKANTASGDQCKRKAVADGFCKQHGDAHFAPSPLPHWPHKDEVERHEIDTVEAEGKTYQIDLMQHSPEFQKFEIAKRIAHTLANSNLVPDEYRGRANDCFVAINMGAEIGMEPFQAIQSIAVINGKPCLYGDGLIGVVRASSKCEWIEETISEDGNSATCRTQRKGEPKPVERTYTMEDAQVAGVLTGKGAWKKHPKRMLQMRARAFCLRDAYPDLLKGLGMVEEMQDHDNTPAPIINYELPKPTKDAIAAAKVHKEAVDAHNEAVESNIGEMLDEAKEVFGDGVTVITFETVERAMHQSDTMEQLLKAAGDAKHLDPNDQAKLRGTYKMMRDAIRDEGHSNG